MVFRRLLVLEQRRDIVHVVDDDVEVAVVVEIADGQAAPDTRDLQPRPARSETSRNACRVFNRS